jgi:assimilatory nitrate reductase catalytic subunit
MAAAAASLRRKDPTVILKNIFLQGIFPFDGAGLEKAVPIHSQLSRFVPDGVINQTLYFRGGNSSTELVTVVLMRDGVPMRYFPIAAKGDVHVPLRVVEDIDGGSLIELRLLADVGVTGYVVIDMGMVEH